jgi:Flp pilus assembly protein TadD
VWWQWLFPLALIAVAAAFWRLRGRTRAPLATLLLFVVTLGPALGFVNVYPFRYSFVADHFQYTASIFAISACAALATVAARGWIASPQARVALAVAPLVPFAILTWRESHHYQSEEVLFRSVVARNPGAWMAHSRLSMIEAEKPTPNVDAALFHAREAARFNPRSAEVHDTLGLLLQHHGQLAEARSAFETAARLNPTLPGPPFNLGMVAYAEGRLDAALVHFQDASRLNPADAEVRRLLAIVTADRARASAPPVLLATGPAAGRLARARAFESQGRLDEAERQYREALKLDPTSAAVRDGLGYVLVREGLFAEAVTHLSEAVRLRPDAAASHASLAYALREIGRLDESIAAYRRAIQFPENATRAAVRNNFGITLAMAGRSADARAEFREALRLDPTLAGVRENLARVGGP